MTIKVGSREARNKFDTLLRGVQEGQCYTITLRGKAVAQLRPAQSVLNAEVVAGVTAIKKLLETCTPIYGVDTKSLIELGRD